MTIIQTGKVIDVQVVPYDVTRNPNINAKERYSPYNHDNIVNSCKEIQETLLLTIEEDERRTFPYPERMSDLNITNEWFCAIDCLAVGLYAPAILFASISVECVLNNDMRLEEWRQ